MQKEPQTAIKAPVGEAKPLALGDAIGDSIASAGELAVGGTTTTLIDAPGDLDYYRITLEAGQAYHFTMTGVAPGPISDAFLEVRDASGNVLQSDDDGGIGTNSSMMFIAPASGDYYVVARGFSNQFGRYTLSAEEVQTGNSSPTEFPPNGLPMYSWDQAALQIARDGSSWNTVTNGAPVVVTYAFRSSSPLPMPSDTQGFQRFTDAQIEAAEAALQAWAQVANIQFVRVGTGTGDQAYANNAAILFGNYTSGESGAAAFAYLPSSGDQSASSLQGDVWINASLAENLDFSPGSYGTQTLLHEIGHALGLTHPSEYNAEEGVSITYEVNAQYFNDSRVFTVMTYFGSPPVGGSLPGFATTPQMHDIAAIQYLYGANTATRTGDTIYGFNSNAGRSEFLLTAADEGAVFSIWDGGGVDTLDLSGYSQNATIDIREEGFSSAGPDSAGTGGARFNISIARGAAIENAIGGAGNDNMIGNRLANNLFGGDGIDTLFGGLGNDSLRGDAGDDTLLGADGDDLMRGGVGSDWMVGGNGDDTFVGGEQGTNVMIGGVGVDIASYADFTANLWVDLSAQVYSAAGVWDSFIEIEGLAGGSGNDTLFGDNAANRLIGNAGIDTLIGRLGNDILVGGLGDDWLDGGDGDDALEGGFGTNVLLGGAGVDLASYTGAGAAIWFNLAAGAYSAVGVWDAFVSIEGAIGSGFADTLFGDTTANMLQGDGGDDSLIGLGGDDTLMGGEGSDWIVGGDGADRMIGGAGIDVLTGGAGADLFDLGAAAGWDVAFDFNTGEDRFSLGGHTWSGFFTVDADGDGQTDDTLLGYAGGNFVALNVAGLTLDQWNALVVNPSSAQSDMDLMAIAADPLGDEAVFAPQWAESNQVFDLDLRNGATTPPWAVEQGWLLPA